MADLGQSGAWDKYVKNKTDSSSIDYVIENNMSNIPVYKDATLKNIVASVSQGQKLKIIAKNFRQVGRSKYASVRIDNINGLVRISAIRKPTKTSGADAEKRTLDLTTTTLNNLKYIAGLGRSNSSGIDLFIPGIGMKLAIESIEKVSNRIHGREAKSDFVLKNALGKEVLFISHKSGDGPGAFGQYGGISEVAGSIEDAPLIYNNPEVQTYLNKLYALYQDAIGPRQIANNPFNSNGKLVKSVSHNIQDNLLINQSVYGSGYGGDFGPDNVHMIGQGSFVFKPFVNDEGDIYFRLSFSGHKSLNGELGVFKNDISGYRATIITTPRTGRSTKTPGGRISEIRTGIYPKSYRTGAVSIDSLL